MLTNKNKIVILFYVAAIIVSVAIVYYINSQYNEAQPTLFIGYNYSSSAGFGSLINTLGFPIQVKYFYCTQPSGKRLEFSNPNSNSIEPGQNTTISLSVANGMSTPNNCTHWSVSYIKTSG